MSAAMSDLPELTPSQKRVLLNDRPANPEAGIEFGEFDYVHIPI
jgi:hypothetical protein